MQIWGFLKPKRHNVRFKIFTYTVIDVVLYLIFIIRHVWGQESISKYCVNV